MLLSEDEILLNKLNISKFKCFVGIERNRLSLKGNLSIMNLNPYKLKDLGVG